MITKEQDEKAFKWLNEHVIHVMNMIMDSNGIWYPPTDSEDVNNPNIWKANHWGWYVTQKGSNNNGSLYW